MASERQQFEVKDGGQGKKGREREREREKRGCLFRENPTPEKKRTQDGETGFSTEMLLIGSDQLE